MRPTRRASLALLALMLAATDAGAQVPERFTNLQVLPADISRDSLTALMRSFTFATGMRCDGCHVREGNAFRYDLDDKPAKQTARTMLRMVTRLNHELAAELPASERARVLVECKTCHRGLARPHLLRTELREVIDVAGTDSAIAHYRQLRTSRMAMGAYDFGEQEMNELARQLATDGKVREALAMLVLNEEFHATSSGIPLEIGRLQERLGDTAAAITAYRRVLERAPNNPVARARLAALGGGLP
jgi:hypothetical protein